MVVAAYFYYEKVRRTMRTAIVSNLFNFYFSTFELLIRSWKIKHFTSSYELKD